MQNEIQQLNKGEVFTIVDLNYLWSALREDWLQSSLSISGSQHTYRAYKKASELWINFIATRGVELWEVTTIDARSWQISMKNQGLRACTINLRMAALSSWYRFVINEVYMINGIERTAFFDANGNTRRNPFQVGNLRREKVNLYGKANPLSLDILSKLFKYLHTRKHTKTGSRNYALILAYFLTACRNHEILHIKWGDIRPSFDNPDSYVFRWRGKGGKTAVTPLPEKVYDAIVDYLKINQRWPIQQEEYVWIPIVTHGCKNLISHGKPKSSPFLSTKNSVRILQTALKLSGIKDYDKYRIHDLRHSFAILYDGDIENLRKLMHHQNIATTGIYLRTLKDPVDNHSDKLFNKLNM